MLLLSDLWKLEKFCIRIPRIQFLTKKFVKLIWAARLSFGLEETNPFNIPAFRTWFGRLRRLAILYFSRLMRLFFAAAFTSFSPCRGFF